MNGKHGIDVRKVRLTVAATLGLMAGAAATLACDGQKAAGHTRAIAAGEAEGRFVRVAAEQQAADGKQARGNGSVNSGTSRTFVWSDGDDDVRVRIEGKSLVAHVNGKEAMKMEGLDGTSEYSVGGDTLVVEAQDDRVSITFNGNEIGRLNLSDDEGGHMNFSGNLSAEDRERMEKRIRGMRREAERVADEVRRSFGQGAPVFPEAPGQRGAWAMAFPPQQSKVMLGVTLDDPDSSDMPPGYDADSATLITSVIEDQPASKAGLLENDLIVKIDGADEASPEALRRMLRSKNPGDKVMLTVVRRNEEDPDKFEVKELQVELAEFDAEVIGTVSFGPMGFMDRGELDKRLEELRANMAARSAALQELSAKMSSNIDERERERVAEKISEMASQIGELAAELARESAEGSVVEFFGSGEASGQSRSFPYSLPRVHIDRDGKGARATIVPSPPPAAEAPGAPVAASPKSSEMEAINQRLDRLEKLLEKLAEEKSKDNR